ncbi:unnamed protein product, partial [Mesorhabditis belari]|uniref:G-protein coupled receptors family 1 profile domain-containing protein n=1 Tax=Mesorhabditis belari TaxID=2138241 RepID=A0AAF3JBE8_9BILA
MEERSACHPSNSSCDCNFLYGYYDVGDRVVLGLIALPIITFGICANLMSIRIFTNRIMLSSTINWFLAAISISDTIILCSAFCVWTLPRLGEYLMFWRAAYWSYMMDPMMLGLMTTGKTLSVYLMLGASVHRYIGVCHPYIASQLLPAERIIKLIVSIAIFSVLFNITRFLEVEVANVCYQINIDYKLPQLWPTKLRENPTYILIFHGWTLTLIMFIIPFTLLIGFNCKVLHAVRKSRKAHMHGDENDDLYRREKRKERKTSIMLVAVVMQFLTCHSLSFVCDILENLGVDKSSWGSLVTANNFAVLVNSSLDIFIYILFSEKEKTSTFKALLFLRVYSLYVLIKH